MKNKKGTIAGGLLMFSLLLGSCKPVKEAGQVDHGSGSGAAERVIGTVRATEDCGYYIEYLVGDVSHSLGPVNLEEKFQVDGMRIKFAYEASGTKPPRNCPNFEPVTVNDVTPLR